VTINHQHVEAGSSSAQGYTEMMVAQLSAGTIADVVANWAYVPFVSQLADLTREAPGAGWKKSELLYNQAQQEVDGRLYMLAMSASNSGWAYNKNLFQEAGIREPDESWTTEQVLDAARRLTRPERGQYGILAPSGPWVGWFELMWAAGAGTKSATTAEVLSAERKRTRLGEGGGPEAFEWYANLIHRHQVAPTPAQARDQGVSFAAGKVGMMPMGIYNTSATAAQVKDSFVWSAMWTPKWGSTGKRASHLVSEGFVVPKVTQTRGASPPPCATSWPTTGTRRRRWWPSSGGRCPSCVSGSRAGSTSARPRSTWRSTPGCSTTGRSSPATSASTTPSSAPG
jgi:ABC-type glycerol-3-phosphate transport system substrate-binding protein